MSGAQGSKGSGAAANRDAWFVRSFDELYLELYHHRDDREAVEFGGVLRAGGIRGPVCEIACGTGRFLRALAARGEAVFGLDLSPALLARAQALLGKGRLVRGDMRAVPFRSGAFATVLLLFTSFGYFLDPAEDRRVIAESARLLRPGGRFVLDFLNLGPTVRTLVAESRREVAGTRVLERRWVDAAGPFLRKTIEVDGGEPTVSGLPREERVRLYGPGELRALLRMHELAIQVEYGSYAGTPFDADRSDRFIAIARKEGGA